VRWLFHLAGRKKKIEFGGWSSADDSRPGVEMVFIGLFGTKSPRWKRDLEKCLVRPGEKVDPRKDPFGAYRERVAGPSPALPL
jgi:hypothetical protein